jgi:drug/metabolite transporter (DMT)-like permease
VVYVFATVLTLALGAWLLWSNRSSRQALAWSVLALGGLFAGLVFIDFSAELPDYVRGLYVVGVVVVIATGLYGAHRARKRGPTQQAVSGDESDQSSSPLPDRRP